MKNALIILAALFHASLCFSQNVRTLKITESEVAQINTALGYSTILQFDARPSSAVLGDQDAFKVEYVGNSITIKPLRGGIRTNLFVFTDYERFNFRLNSGTSTSVDYLVKISRKRTDQSSIPSSVEVVPDSTTESYEAPSQASDLVTRKVGKTTSCQAYSITLTSVAYPRSKPWLIVNFAVSSRSGREEAIDPTYLEVQASQKPLVAETLYIESLKLPATGVPVHGTFMIAKKNPANLSGLSLLFQVPTHTKGQCSRARILLSKTSKGAVNEEKAKN